MSDAPDTGEPVRRARFDRPRWLVVALAVALRVAASVAWARPPVGLQDPWLYQRFARDIAKGLGYVTFEGTPTSYYPPGYPYFLGGIQWVLDQIGWRGALPLTAAIVQSVLAGVAVWAIVGVGDRIDPPTGPFAPPGTTRRIRTGLAAGAVFAVWPNVVVYSTVLLSESLFLPLFALFLLAVTRALTAAEPRVRTWVLPGVLLGLTALVRPQVALVAVALGAGLLVARRSLSQRLVALALVGLVAAAVVLPWSLRNVSTFGRFVAVSTNGGDNMCVGFNPSAQGRFYFPEECDTGEFYIDGPKAEIRRNDETARRARSWAVRNLERIPELSARKLYYTYEHDHDGLRALDSFDRDPTDPPWLRTLLRRGSDVAYAVIMAFAAIGVVVTVGRLWRQRQERAPAAAALAFVFVATFTSALVPLLVFGEPRFKVPATPCFALLAGLAIVAIRRRRGGEAPVWDLSARPRSVTDDTADDPEEAPLEEAPLPEAGSEEPAPEEAAG